MHNMSIPPYGHKTTAMHGNEYPPPVPLPPLYYTWYIGWVGVGKQRHCRIPLPYILHLLYIGWVGVGWRPRCKIILSLRELDGKVFFLAVTTSWRSS